jgi:hypothetical protein
MAVLDGALSFSGAPEVFLGLSSSRCLVLEASAAAGSGSSAAAEPASYSLPCVPLLLSFTADGRYLGAFGESGQLLAYALEDLHKAPLLCYDTLALSAPSSMAWCGQDALALAWADSGRLLLVGPAGDSLELDYGSSSGGAEQGPGSASQIAVIGELDGLRVLGCGDTHEFLQAVPEELVAIR